MSALKALSIVQEEIKKQIGPFSDSQARGLAELLEVITARIHEECLDSEEIAFQQMDPLPELPFDDIVVPTTTPNCVKCAGNTLEKHHHRTLRHLGERCQCGGCKSLG